MLAKVLVVAALICGILGAFSVNAFGLAPVQFDGGGVILLAAAALL